MQKPVLFPIDFHWKTFDPFLFCAYHADQYPKSNGKFGPDAPLSGRDIGSDFTVKDGWRMYHGEKVPGFPGHPHRGFETITVVQSGFVDHADSLGAAGRYSSGDVQWLTAGKGIQHSEMFPLLNEKEKNPAELFQIWLNLPSKNKFVEPGFKMLWNEDIPKVQETDKDGNEYEVTVVAGEFAGKRPPSPPSDSWAADPENGVMILTVKLSPSSVLEIPPAPPGVNRTVYFFEGDFLHFNNTKIESGHAVLTLPESIVHLRNGNSVSRILILQGRPINEPVAQYGPFVMNTQEEIQRAFQDYRATQFGGWPWDSYDPVHDIGLRRFARYTNGQEEFREVNT